MRLARRALLPIISLLVVLVAAMPQVSGAVLGSGTLSSFTITPASQSNPTGAPQSYTITFSCAGVSGGGCGTNAQISIPLDQPNATNPPMTDPSWLYRAVGTPASIIASGPTISGNNLIVDLAPGLIAGTSYSIQLSATPPTGTTWNNTTWTMNPSFSSDEIPATPVSTPATSTATAKPQTSVSKTTVDGGSVYLTNGTVTYNITAKCSTPTTGRLDATTATLTDTFPVGVVPDAATAVPPPTSTSQSGGQYTWTWTFDSSDPSAMPAGCAAGATGPTSFVVPATTPASVPSPNKLTNNVQFSASGPNVLTPGTTTSTSQSSQSIALVSTPSPDPSGPGYATITKSAVAPLYQSSPNGYLATYPGNWVPLASSPSYAAGSAAASYQVTVNYGLVGEYTTTLYDPVPCQTGSTPHLYPSVAYGPSSQCTNVAFHTQSIQVTSAGYDASTGLGQAYAAGWRPQAIGTDGVTYTFANATASVASDAISARFSIGSLNMPAGVAVAELVLPANVALMNRQLQMTLWGYADSALDNQNINEMQNTATAVPGNAACSNGICQAVQAQASVFVIPPKPGLGISKTFGSAGASSGGTTAMNLRGALNVPIVPLSSDVVITDLLPLGMTWANQASTVSLTLNQANGQATTTATGTVAFTANYNSTGQQLIAITIPKASFSTTGSWSITPATNSFLVSVPNTAAVYANTDQIFLYGIGAGNTVNTCTTPGQSSGTSTATYLTGSLPQNYTGDPNANEDFCQGAATLRIGPSGTAFSLTKTVQGDLDSTPLGALGVGNVSLGGTGTFGLTWSNIGTATMYNPVIYDILPYVGDVGVSGAQANEPRNTQFNPVFVGLGPLPPNIGVEYSTSTNPCRPEVFPNQGACDNNWTASPPADITTVAALRFYSLNSTPQNPTPYPSGSTFSVSIIESIPSNDLNTIAWNSAASSATTSNSQSPDPATDFLGAVEPPKVGIKTTSPPGFITEVSQATTTPDQPLSDTITISGVGNSPATVDWKFYGPVAPIDGSCDTVSWGAAPVLESGTFAVSSGDGTYVLGPTHVAGLGCYTWAYSLVDPDYSPYPIAIDPGESGEVTLVQPNTPTITSIATIVKVPNAALWQVADNVSIANSGINIGGASDPSAALTWTLFFAPKPANGCLNVDWTTASTVATGTITVTGDGAYVTPTTTVTASGCYSYSEVLAGSTLREAATQAVGIASETVEAEQLASTGSNLVDGGLVGLVLLGLGLLALRRRRLARS